MNTSTVSAESKLILHGIVNLGGNAAIMSLLPATWQPYAFLAFNLAQVVLAFLDPSFAIHLIQTGAMSVPPKSDQ